jgi:hypothetical protein
MFSIDPADPLKPVLLGQPGASGGDFPTSLAVSTALKMICAAHTGVKAGVSCASFSSTGLGAFDTLRPFDLGQTDPPPGPLNGIGVSFFLEDSSSVITTVKGDPTANKTGFVSIIPAGADGSISCMDTHVTPNGTAVLFGANQIPGTNQLLISDASFGSITLDLASPDVPLTTTTLADQKATCWAQTSPATGVGLLTDVGVNHLVSVDTSTGSIIQDFESKNGNPGMIDFVAVGSKVYALSPGNGAAVGCNVAVFDVASADANGISEVQNFGVDGADVNAQGMAVLLA